MNRVRLFFRRLFMGSSARKRFILWATSGYLIFGSAWIFFSDRLLLAFTDIYALARLSTAKGIAFISLTTLLLLLAFCIIPDRTDQRESLRSAPPCRSSEHLPRWIAYAFALSVTLAMLWVRMQIAVSFDTRSLLILFMLPIILSSVLGGFGPGLAATASAALGINYFAIPPLHSLQIEQPHDLFQWCMLIATGLLASYLNERLHRARKQAEDRQAMQEAAQEKLRASEAKFRYLYENMLNGVIHARMIIQGDTPVDMEYISANPAFATVTGITESVVGRRLSEVIPGYCENNPESLQTFVQVAATGIPRRWEQYLRELDRWFSFSIYSPAHGEVIIVTENITDQKRAEEEIFLLNTDLEQRVEQRTAELTAANQELDSFAYAVSHDLRAPLRAMSGFSQALIEDYGESLQGEARMFLEQIIIGSRKMGELIEGLLTLSRSTRGRLHRDRVDLSEMARRLLAELAQGQPERRVEWRIEPDLVTEGDAAMLEVVLRNLLDNAWKYTARREKALIRFFPRIEGLQHFFCIGDNGAGFDATHANKLFQPFQRLHRQEEFPGTGIGLATAQRIIHRHGGTLLAEGQREQGATFCFNIPSYSAIKRES